jgi:hypothetical protein
MRAFLRTMLAAGVLGQPRGNPAAAAYSPTPATFAIPFWALDRL